MSTVEAFGFLLREFMSRFLGMGKYSKDVAGNFAKQNTPKVPSYQAFVSPSSREVMDVVDLDTGCGVYSGKTMEQFKADFPDVMIMDKALANKLFDDMSITDPIPISKEVWQRAIDTEAVRELLVLETPDQASFKAANNLRGCVTKCYVRIGSKYFGFYDLDHSSHGKMVHKVQRWESNFATEHIDFDLLDDVEAGIDTIPQLD